MRIIKELMEIWPNEVCDSECEIVGVKLVSGILNSSFVDCWQECIMASQKKMALIDMSVILSN